jgi:hypothetical protein
MAQKAQQAFLSVGTVAGTTDVVTGLTNANPGVVTSNAHGNANGVVGVLSAVGGMVQVNNRAFVVDATAANTFALKGVDTTTAQGYGAYTSGGIFTPWTMVEVGEVRGITSAFDGEAADIDVTHLRSAGKEYLTGLPEFGNVSLNLWLPLGTDAGQTRLRNLRETQAAVPLSITLASGQVAAFVGLVKSFALSGIEVDGAVAASCSIKVSNAPAWFA